MSHGVSIKTKISASNIPRKLTVCGLFVDFGYRGAACYIKGYVSMCLLDTLLCFRSTTSMNCLLISIYFLFFSADEISSITADLFKCSRHQYVRLARYVRSVVYPLISIKNAYRFTKVFELLQNLTLTKTCRFDQYFDLKTPIHNTSLVFLEIHVENFEWSLVLASLIELWNQCISSAESR